MMKKKEGATKKTKIETKSNGTFRRETASVSVCLCFKIICHCFSFSVSLTMILLNQPY